MKKSNKGFAALYLLLLLLIVIVLSTVAWWVWQSKNEKSKKNSTPAKSNSAAKNTAPANKPSPVEDITDSWLLYVSPAKEYQFRIPDGWKLERYQQSSGAYAISLASATYSSGNIATVTEVSGGIDFSSAAFSLGYYKSSELSAPEGTMQTGFKTSSGLNVDKYKLVVATEPEIMGPAKGTTLYTYRINKGLYTITISHGVLKGEVDDPTYVEKAIKSVEFL